MWRNYHPPTFTQTPDWDWTPDMSEWQRTFPWEPLCSLGWFGLDHVQRDLFGNTASKTTIQHFVSYQMELPSMRMSQTLSRLPSWNQNLPKCNATKKRRFKTCPRTQQQEYPQLQLSSRSIPVQPVPASTEEDRIHIWNAVSVDVMKLDESGLVVPALLIHIWRHLDESEENMLDEAELKLELTYNATSCWCR